MPSSLQVALTSRHRNLLIHAVAMAFAVTFSVSCIYFTDLVLPNFAARFDNYAFAATIPIAAAPLVVYPILWLLRHVEQTRKALEQMARTDVLTEVANRRGFFEAAEAAFAENDGNVALMMIDVDHFKRVNDVHGHAAGDELLKRLAWLIGEAVRDQPCVIGRIGGEEFALLIAGAGERVARRLAERLCRHARMLAFEQDGRRVGATFSIGISVGGASSLDALLKAADKAVYEAKRLGRDCWSFATDDRPAEIPASAPRAA